MINRLLGCMIAATAIGLFSPGPAQAGVYGVPDTAYDLYPPYGVFPPFRLEQPHPACHQELDRVLTRHGWRIRRVTVCR